jgi:hypothetical protein
MGGAQIVMNKDRHGRDRRRCVLSRENNAKTEPEHLDYLTVPLLQGIIITDSCCSSCISAAKMCKFFTLVQRYCAETFKDCPSHSSIEVCSQQVSTVIMLFAPAFHASSSYTNNILGTCQNTNGQARCYGQPPWSVA